MIPHRVGCGLAFSLPRGTVTRRMEKGGESLRHAELKRLAAQWAQTNGFALCAPEVAVPKSGFRADVAACTRGPDHRTVIFECKQSRPDWLKDHHAEEKTRLALAALIERRRRLEALLAEHRPDLRRGEALWPEYDTWDFSGLEHRAYREVLSDLDLLQRRLRRGTKFSKMFRYRCADFLYLVVEDGIFAEAEVPAGWGLLVRSGPELAVSRRPADLTSAPEQRSALLERIALSGTRAANRALGLGFLPARWTSRETAES